MTIIGSDPQGRGMMNLATKFIKDVTPNTFPCPFCGNEDNSGRSLMALVMVSLIHYVKCEACAATGPVSAEWADANAAIARWNERSGGMYSLGDIQEKG